MRAILARTLSYRAFPWVSWFPGHTDQGRNRVVFLSFEDPVDIVFSPRWFACSWCRRVLVSTGSDFIFLRWAVSIWTRIMTVCLFFGSIAGLICFWGYHFRIYAGVEVLTFFNFRPKAGYFVSGQAILYPTAPLTFCIWSWVGHFTPLALWCRLWGILWFYCCARRVISWSFICEDCSAWVFFIFISFIGLGIKANIVSLLVKFIN